MPQHGGVLLHPEPAAGAVRRPEGAPGVRAWRSTGKPSTTSSSTTPIAWPTASCRRICRATPSRFTAYKYDSAQAKQLLSESEVRGQHAADGADATADSGAAPGDLLVAIQQGWQDALGVNIELQAIDTSAFLREQRRGSFQMHSDGWAADYPDPEDFLGKLFASDSPLNYTRYKNAEVDRLLLAARDRDGPDEALRAVRRGRAAHRGRRRRHPDVLARGSHAGEVLRAELPGRVR